NRFGPDPLAPTGALPPASRPPDDQGGQGWASATRRASAGVQAAARALLSETRSDPAHHRTGPMDKWAAVVEYDPEISAAAATLRPYGNAWVDKLGEAYFALEEDRAYLPHIVQRLLQQAKEETIQEWARAFRQTASGELCTQESLNILYRAQAQG